MSLTLHLELLRTEYADHHRRFAKSKAELEAFELRLESTGLPKWQWRKQVFRLLIQLKRQWERDLNRLLRMGRELKAFEAPAAAKPQNPPAEPPAAEPKKKYQITQTQKVDVKIVDGKTETLFTPDAAHWIRVNCWHLARRFQRIYHFADKQVPPEYAYVLQNDGSRYPPTDFVYIHYETEEFQRICQREVETRSEHALDGERMNYSRLHDREPLTD
jgi:hypothetical protein